VLCVGDELVAIDGHPCGGGVSADDVRELCLGEPGSQCSIALQRAHEALCVVVTRAAA
jgi:C-terminal processing protease CtpA/Prc